MGFGPNATSNDLLGYSMDGFKIYGPLNGTKADVDGILDECNGIEVNGEYQYHVRTKDQVDGEADYCFDDAADSPVINWNYILGCYSGSVSSSGVFDSSSYTLDGDCVEDDGSTPSEAPSISARPTPYMNKKRPNIIVMQPDDLDFFDPWGPPPNNPSEPNKVIPFPAVGLEWMEKLRKFNAIFKIK